MFMLCLSVSFSYTLADNMCRYSCFLEEKVTAQCDHNLGTSLWGWWDSTGIEEG